MSTLENECASQGLDWEEVVEQRLREKNKLQKLGLTAGECEKTGPTNREEQAVSDSE